MSLWLPLHSTPDTPQDEELLEGRQQVQTMRQLHLVGLGAVIQRPPLLRPSHKRLCQSLRTHGRFQLLHCSLLLSGGRCHYVPLSTFIGMDMV